MTRLEIEQSEPANEPSIGYNCDLCGNPGGLMRDDIYDGHGIDSKGAIVHLDICSDCLAKL
jgi:hypothetical protein